MPTNRIDITQDRIDEALGLARIAVERATKKHGHRTFASVHEMYGTLKEEFHEIEKVIFNHTGYEAKEKYHERIHDEMMDTVAVLIFGMACIQQGTLDW